jgi:hypothetical protein
MISKYQINLHIIDLIQSFFVPSALLAGPDFKIMFYSDHSQILSFPQLPDDAVISDSSITSSLFSSSKISVLS